MTTPQYLSVSWENITNAESAQGLGNARWDEIPKTAQNTQNSLLIDIIQTQENGNIQNNNNSPLSTLLTIYHYTLLPDDLKNHALVNFTHSIFHIIFHLHILHSNHLEQTKLPSWSRVAHTPEEYQSFVLNWAKVQWRLVHHTFFTSSIII